MAHILRPFKRGELPVKKSTQCILSTHDERGKLDLQKLFQLFRYIYFEMACGTTDNVSAYESEECRFESGPARKPSFYTHVFGETEQSYPVDRHQKNFAATKRRNIQSAKTLTVFRR